MKLITVLGARPQFIKAAPVSNAFAESNNIEEIIVHTGQHFDQSMSHIFFSELNLKKPKYNLGVNSGTHGYQTGKMLIALDETLVQEKPDFVLVYGDTNSTLAGALSAAKLNIPVIHIEAGLRSYNRSMPEEINRRLTDHASTLLFTPSKSATDTLIREGIDPSSICYSGDVMYDAILHTRTLWEKSTILQSQSLVSGEYVLATLHRAENTDSPARLAYLVSELESLSESQSVVLPIHPRTEKARSHAGLRFDRVKTIPPTGYLDTQKLLDNAAAVVTDSGGLQKEAYFHSKVCVTMRDETEWTELMDGTWNQLLFPAKLEKNALVRKLETVLKAAVRSPQQSNIYGSGKAATIIQRKISEIDNTA